MRVLRIMLLAGLVMSGCMTTSPDGPVYDSVAPGITKWMREPAILVFSKTKGWRHNAGIAGANRYLADWAEASGYGLFTTENGAVFNTEDLARFKLVVFNNVTGDVLSSDQRRDFKDWLEQGGGWVGLHSAGDASHTAWSWYDTTLIGPEFIGHPAAPQLQDANLVVLNIDHPITEGLPAQWSLRDEWYSFDSRPQDHGLTPLIGLDETSYSPVNVVYGDVSDLRMGQRAIDHPVVWSGRIKAGRVVYSAIGHTQYSYDDLTYGLLLNNILDWVLGDE